MAEKLRDLSHPIDVQVVDDTIATFYGSGFKEEVMHPARSPLPTLRAGFASWPPRAAAGTSVRVR
jgi:hypothetical protein